MRSAKRGKLRHWPRVALTCGHRRRVFAYLVGRWGGQPYQWKPREVVREDRGNNACVQGLHTIFFHERCLIRLTLLAVSNRV
jgi:predicted transcriptional regulator with HTH domain